MMTVKAKTVAMMTVVANAAMEKMIVVGQKDGSEEDTKPVEASAYNVGNEYRLMSQQKKFCFVQSAKVLSDLNVFIRDTGATGDTTNSCYAFIDIRNTTAKDNIADALGNNISSNVVGGLKGT
eukprot:6372860-Ditylum_brightwellii.AAC.1